MEVQISLESAVLYDYARYLFPPDQDGYLSVKGSTFAGKFFIAACRESLVRVPPLDGDYVATLRLPKQAATQDLDNKFLYYTVGDMKRLNVYLRASYNLDFKAYFLEGVTMGIQRKDIIEAFIVSRQLVSVDPTDALLKRAYRDDRKKLDYLTKYLLRKSYYITEALDKSGLQKNIR